MATELPGLASSGRCGRLHVVDAAGVELHQAALQQAVAGVDLLRLVELPN